MWGKEGAGNDPRKGSEANLEWLRQNGPLTFINGDVRDYDLLREVFEDHRDVDVVMHFAAQVAVRALTPSPSPKIGRGERGEGQGPAFIFASANKVYGRMEDVAIVERDGRYEYRNLPQGVGEARPLDPLSPYGCSKGAADQYVLDYARIYGLRTVSFRQSCCYGYRQFGVEDQGWVAWFTIAAVLGKPITIYGDGKQVRDVLFIDDLVDLYLRAHSPDLRALVSHCGGP